MCSFFESVTVKVRVSFHSTDQQLGMICPSDPLRGKNDFFYKLVFRIVVLQPETFLFILLFKIISNNFIIVLFNMENVLLYINYAYFKKS